MNRRGDPALETARQLLEGVCECGDTDGEHEGRRASVGAPPDGACGVVGCLCERFTPAKLVVSRAALNVEPLVAELRARSTALRKRRHLGDLLLASSLDDLEVRVRELLRTSASVASAPSDLAGLPFSELNRRSIRTGCETADNVAADMELRRRGYVFDAGASRWTKKEPG